MLYTSRIQPVQDVECTCEKSKPLSYALNILVRSISDWGRGQRFYLLGVELFNYRLFSPIVSIHPYRAIECILFAGQRCH